MKGLRVTNIELTNKRKRKKKRKGKGFFVVGISSRQ